jgi:hypothetical protein
MVGGRLDNNPGGPQTIPDRVRGGVNPAIVEFFGGGGVPYGGDTLGLVAANPNRNA